MAAAVLLAVLLSFTAVVADDGGTDAVTGEAPTQALPPVIKDDLAADSDFFLMADTVVTEGGSLTIGGDLDVMDKTLTVNGTLVIKEGATVFSSQPLGAIVLGTDGKVSVQGTVGDGLRFYGHSGCLTACNVTGLELSSDSIGDAIFSDKCLRVDGEVSATADMPRFQSDAVLFGDIVLGDLKDRQVHMANTVVLSGTVLPGCTMELTGDSAVSVRALSLSGGSQMTIDGTVYKANIAGPEVGLILLSDGSRVTVDTFVTALDESNYDMFRVVKFATLTGTYAAPAGPSSLGALSSIALVNMENLVIEADTRDVSGDGSQFEQMLTVYSPDGARTTPSEDGQVLKDPSMFVEGYVYVLDGKELVLSDGMHIITDSEETDQNVGAVVAEGTVEVAGDTVGAYRGAHYAVDGHNFYGTFENALASGSQEITMMGGYLFTGNHVLEAGHTLLFDNTVFGFTGIAPDYVIAADSSLEVRSGAIVAPDMANFTDIEGRLIVTDGARCVVSDDAYFDMSEDDGSTVYTGESYVVTDGGRDSDTNTVLYVILALIILTVLGAAYWFTRNVF